MKRFVQFESKTAVFAVSYYDENSAIGTIAGFQAIGRYGVLK